MPTSESVALEIITMSKCRMGCNILQIVFYNTPQSFYYSEDCHPTMFGTCVGLVAHQQTTQTETYNWGDIATASCDQHLDKTSFEYNPRRFCKNKPHNTSRRIHQGDYLHKMFGFPIQEDFCGLSKRWKWVGISKYLPLKLTRPVVNVHGLQMPQNLTDLHSAGFDVKLPTIISWNCAYGAIFDMFEPFLKRDPTG